MSLIELIHLVSGGVDGKGSFLPAACGVGHGKLGESEDDVFLSTIHYMEEDLVEYSSNVDIEHSGEMDVTSFVGCGISVPYWDRVFEAGLRVLMLLYEVPVYTGDLGSGVDEGTGVNIF